METSARVHVAAAGARHGRGENSVGQSGEDRGYGGEEVGGQDVRSDTGHAPLDHERDHVYRGTQHGTDARGGQAEQSQLSS